MDLLLAIGGVAHLQLELGDDLRVRLVGNVDDLRITPQSLSPVTRAFKTSRACRAAALVRAYEVRVPVDLYGDHGLGYPLIPPEELADDPDFRMGAAVLIVADVLDHQTVRAGQRAGAVGYALLPRIQPRPLGHTGLESRRVEL